MAETAKAPAPASSKAGAFQDKDKPTEVRLSNILAAKGKQDDPFYSYQGSWIQDTRTHWESDLDSKLNTAFILYSCW